jgi:hypothetical protein
MNRAQKAVDATADHYLGSDDHPIDPKDIRNASGNPPTRRRRKP